MRRLTVISAVGLALTAWACMPGADGPWFRGSFEDALAEAAATERLVMVEFYTDWCSWCRRLENETLSDPQVVDELRELVAIRLDAEGRGREIAARYGVDRYPTIVFVDTTGSEVDRILGFLPPERFLVELGRIRAGDGFFACLERLADDPSDADAMRRSVEGFLERSDPEGAIAKIEAFHAAGVHDHAVCRALMFRARSELLTRVYVRSAKAWREGRNLGEVSASWTPHLARIARSWETLDRDARAAMLREARREDAEDVLRILDAATASSAELFDAAGFAFANGRYDVAAELYGEWNESIGDDADPLALEEAAWQLYLARDNLELARSLADRAWRERPTPAAVETLSRIAYAQGDIDTALRLQDQTAGDDVDGVAGSSRRAARRMQAGQPLDDRPAFESWPGPTGRSL